jgi:HTH-type transcriptional regulator / antitoxin HigA
MMDVKPLRNEQDYDWAIAEVTPYFDHEPVTGTPDGDRFEILTILVHEYEKKQFAMPHLNPIDVLNFAIESMGKSQADLENVIGQNCASEILNRIRPLTLDMIRDISAEWIIPIELLTPRYELARACSTPRKSS